MAASSDVHGFAVGSIGVAAVSLYHGALKDGADKGDPRGGLVVASAFVLALGASSAVVLSDYRPFAFAVLIALTFGGAYLLVEGRQPTSG